MDYTPHVYFPDLLSKYTIWNKLLQIYYQPKSEEKTSPEKLSRNTNTEIFSTKYCFIQSCNKPLIIEINGLSHY